MFEINNIVIFENVDECKKYFENFIEQYCENDVEMLNNAKTSFEYVKNKYNSKNVIYVKYDDTFLIIKCYLHIATNKCYYEINSYYITDEFEFLYNEKTTCN